MSDLRAAIQDRIDQPGNVYLETRAYVAAIQAVLDLHGECEGPCRTLTRIAEAFEVSVGADT